jgi:hypothetical protein
MVIGTKSFCRGKFLVNDLSFYSSHNPSTPVLMRHIIELLISTVGSFMGLRQDMGKKS